VTAFDRAAVRGWVPRDAAEHKDERGRLLVVGGTHLRYSGAALLASAAAARCGAGVVTLAVPRALAIALAGRVPEITFLPLAEAAPGVADSAAARQIGDALAQGRFRSLTVGPGCVDDVVGTALVLGALERAIVPTVIDAGALNALARVPQWPSRVPSDAVLTPHLGEARRLAGAEVSSDRVGWAMERAREWRAVVTLKGPCTVVASPDGDVFAHDRPNPALATAGTGDVLAGCIGALLAAGLPPFRAACVGVALHGEAGALTAAEVGSRGAVASDVVARLPRALEALSR
jgi:hydroxyethylthiazole kinase-like uncharacterized protein yjeF